MAILTRRNSEREGVVAGCARAAQIFTKDAG